MYDKIMESVEFIKSKVKRSPKIGVILGSGLGNLVMRIFQTSQYLQLKVMKEN